MGYKLKVLKPVTQQPLRNQGVAYLDDRLYSGSFAFIFATNLVSNYMTHVARWLTEEGARRGFVCSSFAVQVKDFCFVVRANIEGQESRIFVLFAVFIHNADLNATFTHFACFADFYRDYASDAGIFHDSTDVGHRVGTGDETYNDFIVSWANIVHLHWGEQWINANNVQKIDLFEKYLRLTRLNYPAFQANFQAINNDIYNDPVTFPASYRFMVPGVRPQEVVVNEINTISYFFDLKIRAFPVAFLDDIASYYEPVLFTDTECVVRVEHYRLYQLAKSNIEFLGLSALDLTDLMLAPGKYYINQPRDLYYLAE